ncbi:2TM domain-containing protein [Synechococcus sp. B60.1]|uniref:2TM domain-containing protein n=2 Tax=unclassified Synechococcus TaxID=2626047 RepID=UPI0039C02F33
MRVDSMSGSRYSQEDVQQILQRAIARQPRLGEFTRAQLQEMAAELGISPQELDLAEQEWKAWQELNNQHREFQRYRRRQFYQLLGRYAIVNSFLLGLDWLSGGGLSWSLFILMGWGLTVSLKGWNAYQTEGERYEREFRQWQKKRKKQLQRR